jgi:hypothetical protein
MAEHPRPALPGPQDRNVLNKLPKSQHAKAKEIWMAETKKDALAAFDASSKPGPSNTTRRSNA